MTKNYKILGKFIKDISSETKDVETYLFVKDRITKYKLDISIQSKALKEKIIGVYTSLKFEDKEDVKKKSYFEITYTTIVRIENQIEKKELEKIILCDVQEEIRPDLETAFENIISNSGYTGIKFEKKIDFEKLYKQKIS
tara:strand:+ start:789 stop:1208 length:420 start_codon:yes stop_codon:yes gene_type:complete